MSKVCSADVVRCEWLRVLGKGRNGGGRRALTYPEKGPPGRAAHGQHGQAAEWAVEWAARWAVRRQRGGRGGGGGGGGGVGRGGGREVGRVGGRGAAWEAVRWAAWEAARRKKVR